MRVFTLDPEYDRSDAVRRIQFAPDGRALAAVVGGREAATAVSFWDLAGGGPAGRHDVATGDLDCYALPAVSPDLSRVAYHAFADAAGIDSVVIEPAGGGPGRELGGDDEEYLVHCLGFTPDGQTLLAGAGGADGPRVARWDVAELLRGGRQAATTAAAEPIGLGGADPDALACSPAGRLVAVGTADGPILLVDPAADEVVRVLRAKRARRPRVAAPRRLAFSPDGSLLAVRANGTVTVWDAAPGGTGRPLVELTGPRPLTDAGWSPDGRALATACADGSATFWSAADGFAERTRFDWGLGPLTAVAFAPDGLTCAAGADRGRVVLWDVDG